MGNLSLLQGIFPTHGPNPGFLHCRWILYHLSHQFSSVQFSRSVVSEAPKDHIFAEFKKLRIFPDCSYLLLLTCYQCPGAMVFTSSICFSSPEPLPAQKAINSLIHSTHIDHFLTTQLHATANMFLLLICLVLSIDLFFLNFILFLNFTILY